MDSEQLIKQIAHGLDMAEKFHAHMGEEVKAMADLIEAVSGGEQKSTDLYAFAMATIQSLVEQKKLMLRREDF